MLECRLTPSGADVTPPTVSLTSPISGALTNNPKPTFAATAVDNVGGSGVASVQFQYSTNNGSSWINVGAAQTSAPYSVTPTASLPQGALLARAVAVDNSGNSAATNQFALNTLATFVGTPVDADSALTRDTEGDLFGTTNGAGDVFGTTTFGGPSNAGTVFEIPVGTGTIQTIQAFNGITGGTNGGNPFSGMVIDSHGNIFGTTEAGGTVGIGILFELVAPTHAFTTVQSFDFTTNGAPEANLAIDANDNVYGTTRGNADLGENGGILLGPGANQTVQGNKINLAGAGGATNASFGIMSFTSGGNDWNNLLIDNNTITVTTPGANEKILGIGENSGSVGSNIAVTNNTFVGTSGSDPANQQIAFGITSESVAATASNPAATVAYAGNSVQGANEGFVWGDPEARPAYDFTSSKYLGIAFSATTLTNVDVGFVARDGGKATIGTTTITNSGMFRFGTAFHADGAGSVITVTDPTTNYAGVNALADQTNSGLVIFLSVGASFQDVSKAEGNSGFTLFSFPVMLDVAPAANQTFTVQYSTSNGTADGNDYNSASGTLTFLPGQSSAAIAVRVLGDFTPEPNEAFFVNLSDPLLITNGVAAPGNLSRTQDIGTIVNDDATSLSASISGVSHAEGNSGTTLFTFPAVLNAAPTAGQFYTVDYQTSLAGSGAVSPTATTSRRSPARSPSLLGRPRRQARSPWPSTATRQSSRTSPSTLRSRTRDSTSRPRRRRFPATSGQRRRRARFSTTTRPAASCR